MTNGPDTGNKPLIATHDAAGNALTSADKTASITTTTTFTRNLLDQVMTEARGDGSDAKTTYDPIGNPVDRCTWAAGLTLGDRLPVGTTGWTNPRTNATSTRWDASNGRIGLTDSGSNRTTVYDPDHGYALSAVYLPTDADQTREHQSLLYGGTWREMADIVADGVRTTMLPLADPTTLLAEWLGDPAFPDSLDVACFAAAVAIELGDTAALRRLLPHLRRAATVESWMDAVRIRDLVSTAERPVAG